RRKGVAGGGDAAGLGAQMLEANRRREVDGAERVLEISRVVEREEAARRARHTLVAEPIRSIVLGDGRVLTRVERPIALGILVETDAQLVREPAERLVVRRDARRRAVVVGVVLDVVPQAWRRKPEAGLRRIEKLRGAPHEIAEWIRVDLARLRETNAGLNVAETPVDAQLRIRLDVQVRPAAELAVPVPRHDADVPVDGGREEITSDVRSAR